VPGKRFTRPLSSLLLVGSLAAAGVEQMPTDERTIRALEEEQRVAVLNRDVAALERLWSPAFTVNNPQNGISANREAVLDRVRRGLISYSAYEARIEAIRFSGDVAIVMGAEMVTPEGDSPRAGQTVHRRFTDIWQRSNLEPGPGWQAIARHASVIATAGAPARDSRRSASR
jgi:ketosteroid isomerase-like protein